MGISLYRPFIPFSFYKMIWDTKVNGSSIPGKDFPAISRTATLGTPVLLNHGYPYLKKPDFNYTNYRK